MNSFEIALISLPNLITLLIFLVQKISDSQGTFTFEFTYKGWKTSDLRNLIYFTIHSI